MDYRQESQNRRREEERSWRKQLKKGDVAMVGDHRAGFREVSVTKATPTRFDAGCTFIRETGKVYGGQLWNYDDIVLKPGGENMVDAEAQEAKRAAEEVLRARHREICNRVMDERPGDAALDRIERILAGSSEEVADADVVGLWKTLAAGSTPTDQEIADELHEVCENLRGDACDACPVYEARGGDIDRTKSGNGCDAFKDGPVMLTIIRENGK